MSYGAGILGGFGQVPGLLGSKGAAQQQPQSGGRDWSRIMDIVGGGLRDLDPMGSGGNLDAVRARLANEDGVRDARKRLEGAIGNLTPEQQAFARANPDAFFSAQAANVFPDQMEQARFQADREDRGQDVAHRDRVFEAGRSDRGQDVNFRERQFGADRQDRAEDVSYRDSRAERGDMESDRAFGLQAQAAQRSANERQSFEDADGVRRYVDDGSAVFQSDIQEGGGDTFEFGADSMARAAISLPGLISANEQLDQLMADGVRFNSSLDNTIATGLDSIPFGLGEVGARRIGGEDWQALQRASAAFEAAILPLISGSAVTDGEARRTVRAALPSPGDSDETLESKAVQRRQMVEMARAGVTGAPVDVEAVSGRGAPLPDDLPDATGLPDGTLAEDGSDTFITFNGRWRRQ